MPLFNIFDTAGSGMSAQMVRLNTTASNLANADAVATSPEQAYRARHPVFAAALAEAGRAYESAPVQVAGITESAAPPKAEYAPDHPMANEDGYVYHANVNVMEEMTNMISASRTYQNNVEALKTTKQLLLQTLRLGQ